MTDRQTEHSLMTGKISGATFWKESRIEKIFSISDSLNTEEKSITWNLNEFETIKISTIWLSDRWHRVKLWVSQLYKFYRVWVDLSDLSSFT